MYCAHRQSTPGTVDLTSCGTGERRADHRILMLPYFLALSVALHIAVVMAWPASAPHAGRDAGALQVALQAQPGPPPLTAAVSATPTRRRSTAAPAHKVHPAAHTAHRPTRQTDPGRVRAAAHERYGPAPPVPRHAEKKVPASPPPTPAAARTTAGPHVPPRQAAAGPPPDRRAVTAVMGGDGNAAAASARPAAHRSPHPPAGAALHLRSDLFDRLRAHFQYPLIARMRGWEGMVKVGVRVEADGTLSHLRVIETSGYSVLDENSLRTVKAIAHLPRAAAWLHGHHVDLVLPVKYRLTAGG